MSIAFDNATDLGTFSGGTKTLTAAHTCSGVNRLLLVSSYNYQLPQDSTSDTTTGITYDGQALTRLTNKQVPNNAGFWLSLWYLVNPPTGSNNVVVTTSLNLLTTTAFATSYTGVDQDDAFDVTGTAGATSTSISKTLTTTVDKTWDLAVAQAEQTDLSAGSGTTIREGGVGTSSGNKVSCDGNAIVTPAGSTTLNLNSSISRNIAMIMTTINPGADIGGGFLLNLL